MTPEIITKTKSYISFRDSSINVVDGNVDLAIEFAEDRFSESVFGDKYYMAIGLYILHILELNSAVSNGGKSQAGVVSKEKEAMLEVTLDTTVGTSKSSSEDYSRTGYGRELNVLSKENVSGKTLFNSRMAQMGLY